MCLVGTYLHRRVTHCNARAGRQVSLIPVPHDRTSGFSCDGQCGNAFVSRSDEAFRKKGLIAFIEVPDMRSAHVTQQFKQQLFISNFVTRYIRIHLAVIVIENF